MRQMIKGGRFFSQFLTTYLFIARQVKQNICLQTIPLHLVCYWKCEPAQTDFRLDFRYNRAQRAPLGNVHVLVPVDGEVTHMQSKPTATW